MVSKSEKQLPSLAESKASFSLHLISIFTQQYTKFKLLLSHVCLGLICDAVFASQDFLQAIEHPTLAVFLNLFVLSAGLLHRNNLSSTNTTHDIYLTVSYLVTMNLSACFFMSDRVT